MNTLDRYLYRTVLVYTLMAMAVLLTLGGAVRVHQPTKRYRHRQLQRGRCVSVHPPEPAASRHSSCCRSARMIGALMGLGNLAAGSELVVTRASGVSVWRIAWPVGLAGLTLAMIMYAIGEYAAPPLAQFAKREKTTAKLADVSFAGTEQRLGEGRQSHPAGANRRSGSGVRRRLAV